MGKLERENKKRTRKRNIQRAILFTVATAGVIGIEGLVPGLGGPIAELLLSHHKRGQEYLNQSRRRLVSSGLLAYDGKFLRLTRKGEARLRQLELNEFALKRPRRWDKKWRIIIFDIPEYRKSLREKVRRTLAAIGFVRLQDSVWFYPYDCEDLITLLKADFRIGKDMIYIIADFIELDRAYKQKFGLT